MWTSQDFALGQAVEVARQSQGLSIRAAAREAGISEGRWRQVVSGVQKTGGVDVPVNPSAKTVLGMARAVGMDAETALSLNGMEVPPEVVDRRPGLLDYTDDELLAEVGRRMKGEKPDDPAHQKRPRQPLREVTSEELRTSTARQPGALPPAPESDT